MFFLCGDMLGFFVIVISNGRLISKQSAITNLDFSWIYRNLLYQLPRHEIMCQFEHSYYPSVATRLVQSQLTQVFLSD